MFILFKNGTNFTLNKNLKTLLVKRYFQKPITPF